ncbi:MAG: CCA tRNA nucleotidyltransferase, partial [Erythrobacter sp.]|nr:CCA tRNA nucleotidyltransferase [Erythrobacter sp.]
EAKDAENPKALAYQLGVEFAQDRLILLDKDASIITEFTPPRFPLKGGQIVAKGVAAGPEVARMMQTVERRWVSEGFPDIARIDQILDEELRQIGHE